MFCNNCGHEIEDKAKFCVHCGYNVISLASSKKSCPICGKEASSIEQTYCDECGTMLKEISNIDTIQNDALLYKESIMDKAEKGDKEAQNLLGFYYATGTGGMEHDEEKARYYFEEAAAKGNANAQYNLASFYARGFGGLEKNDYQAEMWLKKATDLGHFAAQNAMKKCYGVNNTVVEAFLPLIGIGMRAAKKASRKDYVWMLFH